MSCDHSGGYPHPGHAHNLTLGPAPAPVVPSTQRPGYVTLPRWGRSQSSLILTSTYTIFSPQAAPGLVGGAAAAAGHALARILSLAGGELRSCAGPDL